MALSLLGPVVDWYSEFEHGAKREMTVRNRSLESALAAETECDQV
jgi:hypothetical protein